MLLDDYRQSLDPYGDIFKTFALSGGYHPLYSLIIGDICSTKENRLTSQKNSRSIFIKQLFARVTLDFFHF